MLREARVHPTLPARDLQRARSFYADKLGLTPSQETPGGLFYEAGPNQAAWMKDSEGNVLGMVQFSNEI